MSADLAARPAHVPAELLFDFDVYDPPGAADDYHAALQRIHELGAPDIFWTPRKGGPLQVFMSIVDVPAADREQLLAWADSMVRPEKPEDVMGTIQQILAYAAGKIAERRARPGGDLITALTRASVKDRPITDDEITGMVSLILIGGMDTVVFAMSFAANFLARSAQHRHQLSERPELIPRAVDELLRRFPIVNLGRYVAKEKVCPIAINAPACVSSMW